MLKFTGEPTLDDLLSEPIVQAVMRSDSVERRDLCRLMAETRTSRDEAAPKRRDR